jgi:hypothetical protein
MRRVAPADVLGGCNYRYPNGVGPAVLEGFPQDLFLVEIVWGALRVAGCPRFGRPRDSVADAAEL